MFILSDSNLITLPNPTDALKGRWFFAWYQKNTFWNSGFFRIYRPRAGTQCFYDTLPGSKTKWHSVYVSWRDQRRNTKSPLWVGWCMTYYAVIDTNILVSALLSSHENAATVQVVSRLFSNDGILAEYNEVLRRKKISLFWRCRSYSTRYHHIHRRKYHSFSIRWSSSRHERSSLLRSCFWKRSG